MTRRKPKGKVYLLHFTRKYHHAGHYLGFAEDVEERLERHRKGQGARLIEVIVAAGIDFVLVREWDGDRKLERRLKKWKKSSQLCPICQAAKKKETTARPVVIKSKAKRRRGRKAA